MIANRFHTSLAVFGVFDSRQRTYGDGVHVRRAFAPVGLAAFAALPLSLGAHYLGLPTTVAPLAAALSFLIIGRGGSFCRSGHGSALAMAAFVAVAGFLETALVVVADDLLRAPLSLLATVLLVATPYVRLRRDSLRRLAEARRQAEKQTRLLSSVIEDAIAVVDHMGRLHAATDRFYEEPSRGWPTDELLDRVHVLDRPKLLDALDRSAVSRRASSLDIRLDRSSREDACAFDSVRLSLAPMEQEGLVRLTLALPRPCETECDAFSLDGIGDLTGPQAVAPRTEVPLQMAVA